MKLTANTILSILFTFVVFTSCSKYKQDLDLDWKRLNASDYTVKYCQHNFNCCPTDSTMDLTVQDFIDRHDLMTLDSIDVSRLVQLINDSTNFSNGDCGTFALNAGIIVFKGDTIKGLISIGCSFNQWNFEPHNPNTKWGSIDTIAFHKMEKMLDEINLKNKVGESE